MAASTSLSFSNTLFYTFPSSSTRSQFLAPYHHYSKHPYFLVSSRNPIVAIKDKSFSYSLSDVYKPILVNNGKQQRGFFPKASSSDPIQDSSSQTAGISDKSRDSAHETGQNKFPSLMSLLQVYKEAILDGDEKTESEIEAIISKIEKEKNKLVEKVSYMSAEISSGKEKHIRLQADFENYRKRSEKERLTVRTEAKGEAIESLLPMVDNFERAKQQLKLETEKEKKIDASYQGIYKQFVEIMRSLQVAAVPTVGKPFDPAVHEAIAREESQEFKEGIVTQEFRRGFLLGGRLLRPAMVKVSSGPGKRQMASTADKSFDQSATVAGVDER